MSLYKPNNYNKITGIKTKTNKITMYFDVLSFIFLTVG